jgi:hypothetical protein
MLLACEFSEFGIDPHLIADIIRRHWRLKQKLFVAVGLVPWYSAENNPADDIHIVIEPRFMSFAWERKWSISSATRIAAGGVAEPVWIHQPIKATDIEAYWQALANGQRFFTFNLSAQIRAVTRALESGAK